MIVDAGVVIAAFIGAVPATAAAAAALRTQRDVKTNHGKRIGEHVEDLVEWTDSMTSWAEYHQAADNEVRTQLGLPPAMRPFNPPRPVASLGEEGSTP